LDLLLRKAAGLLAARGLRPGQRFVVVGEPEVEVLLLVYAGLLSGVVPVVLHPGSPAARVADAVAVSGAPVAFDGAAVRSPELAAELGAAAAWQGPAPDPDAEALVLLSSGSTGPARAVRLSQRALCAGARRLSALCPVHPGEIVVHPATLHAVTTLRMVLLGAALDGTTTVLVDPAAIPAAALAAAARQGAHVLYGGPGFVRAAARGAERLAGLRGPRLRAMVVGGGRLSPEELVRFTTGLGVSLAYTYGMTETAGTCAGAWIEPGQTPPPGVGRPLVPVEIRDEAGTPCDVGQVGRIWLAPDPPMLGTLDGEAPVWRGGRLWVRTGDRGCLDADGFLHVVGRAGRTYTAPGGDKVQLDDLETTLRAVVGAEVVACVRRPAGRQPELVAVVERPEVGARWRAEVEAELAGRLPPAARPTRWIAWAPLPRLPGGKLDLRAIDARVEEA
ncbi:MAG: long-chain fatty acid--CoA ligase, partial [Deltaproteobacteria bacterium]